MAEVYYIYINILHNSKRFYIRVKSKYFLTEEQQEDDTPKPDWKPPPEVPREENRSGSNKKTYFVCNDRKLLFINDRLLFHEH